MIFLDILQMKESFLSRPCIIISAHSALSPDRETVWQYEKSGFEKGERRSGRKDLERNL